LPGLFYECLCNNSSRFIAVRVSDAGTGMTAFARDIEPAVFAVELGAPAKKLLYQLRPSANHQFNYLLITYSTSGLERVGYM